jgi:hypothetical protein
MRKEPTVDRERIKTLKSIADADLSDTRELNEKCRNQALLVSSLKEQLKDLKRPDRQDHGTAKAIFKLEAQLTEEQERLAEFRPRYERSADLRQSSAQLLDQCERHLETCR